LTLTSDDLHRLFKEQFTALLEGPWSDWRQSYIDHVRAVATADQAAWLSPQFQQSLWDDSSVSSVGPGQSVTLVKAYADLDLARLLWEAKTSITGLPTGERGAALQSLYDRVMSLVYPKYTPRRPKARLVRLLAAIFPEDLTCLMDASRTFGVLRLLGAPRLSGDFVAQNPSIREQVREVLGQTGTIESNVEQSMFTWFLWQELLDAQDAGAVHLQPVHREATAVPPFSLLPASAQRRSLTCVKGNVELLMAMIREAEQGIGRDDLVSVILTEATQLNASSAGNIISQAMGGLGLLQLNGATYRPTERGLEMLVAQHPEHVLRGPLVGRVFGMGQLLKIVQREPGKLRPVDLSNKLKDLVPTWTSTQPGSYIFAWAKVVGFVRVDGSAGGGRLTLTEDGEDYAAALPEDFESTWTIEPEADELIGVGGIGPDDVVGAAGSGSTSLHHYGVDLIIEDGCFLPREEVTRAVELLRRKKNLILQGPPGTGKTWLAKRLGYALMGSVDHERLTAVQFQPSLSYEDFVRGWRPDGTGGLRLADGVFLDAVYAALGDPDRPYVLVIEEINRGNPAQILGEMLTLIEDSKRSKGEALRLAYPRTVDERIFVPQNLYIIGTMNLADRSLALVDLALRRRFAFLSLGPLLNDAWREWTSKRGCPASLIAKIELRFSALNNAIASDQTLGPQYRVGHSFVTPSTSQQWPEDEWVGWYTGVVQTEIAPLLDEYWYDRPNEAAIQISNLLEGF
jgi:5-methylcytosine-specific restriction protein B